MTARWLTLLSVCVAAVLVGACSQGNSGDQSTTAAAGVASIPTGIDRFLLFPNPIQSASDFETNTTEYAEAYYRAVDPGNARLTLAAWKSANGFGGSTGEERSAIFRDVQDLGYGRRMTARMNTDGSVAFFVENYDVSVVPGSYSSLNVDAAIARDQRWHVGTNAIEYSTTACDATQDPATCVDGIKFAKFYNFSATTGERQLFVDLDGKGPKAMPGPCISCHGGRGDALTPADGTGQKRFPYVGNSASNKRGDAEAHLQPFRIETFGYSATPGYTRADLEPTLKKFNQWVLCSYPLVGAAVAPDDTTNCGTGGRRTATASEWQATAAEMIKAWYGGPGMPNATYDDAYLPAGWAGNANLYRTVVVPYCRTCHILRGSAGQSDIDFHTLAKFQGYRDRIKQHVFDRGNMPLARLVYEEFWEDTQAPQLLANFLDGLGGTGTATEGSGAPLRPGRPVADPGPAKFMVRAATDATLSGANSLFASSYAWSVVSQPAGGDATLTNPTTATPVFRATVTGNYTVRLQVTGSGGATDAKNTVVTVNSSFPDPASIGFATVIDVLRNITHTDSSSASRTCQSCHTITNSPRPPVFYTSTIDRDRSGGAPDATDETWLYREILGRVNFTEVAASPLLRKPSGEHHNGVDILDLNSVAGLSNYSKLYFWILNGAPAGGVQANAGANSSETVTFSGAPPSASIALSGSASIGTITSYQWSVLSGPSGASVSSATSQNATLVVQNVGSYVVQLTVSGGGSSSSSTRTITVNETAVAASFTPAGAVAVTFTGSPTATGSLTLTNTSTGNPTTCQWQVTPSGTLSSTTSCTTTTLTVAATGAYSVTFTGSNVSTTNAVTQAINVSALGSDPVANAGTSPQAATVAFTNPTLILNGDGFGQVPDPNAIPVGTVSLNGSASAGPGTLSYTWEIRQQPGTATGSYTATLSSTTVASPTLTVHRAGQYIVRLTVANGIGSPHFVDKTINVSVPSNSDTFSDILPLFASLGCTGAGCHQAGAGETGVNNGNNAPSWVDDSPPGALYARIALRIDATNPARSLLLMNPSNAEFSPNNYTFGTGGFGHGGSYQSGFGPVIAPPGDESNYNRFLNWIMGGAQP